MRNNLLILGVVAILFILGNSLFIVKQTEQVLVSQFGEVKRVITAPGLHLKIPFIQQVRYFDKRILSVTAAEKEITSKDKKRFIVSAYFKYRIIDSLAFYQSLSNIESGQTRLDAIVKSSLAEVLGTEDMLSLLSDRRTAIMHEMERIIQQKTSRYGIKVEDLRIMRADLPQSNSEAIYQRMQTDRQQEAKKLRAEGYEKAQEIRADADRQQNIIISEADKKALILRGEGDKLATKIYADAYRKDPRFFKFMRSLQAKQQVFADDNTKWILAPSSNLLKE